ncbi:hypothetical protein HOLleu_01044 [Holothuria leucospilota]|uniref:Uncharacterized protein n=1 Tax=Holothuria leucospilota TaxID=206669 RepID=A0A9Q1CMY9_HOLLE|nr:hypothetical protein HOLleu_01044 [Holothuria leucospilota]
MTGKKSGVGARLKEHQPKLQTIHCIAHRLELAIKDAAKSTAMFGKMGRFLANIYFFYHNSTHNRGLLRRTAEALGIKRFIPTRTGGTRWVVHTLNALTNLFAGYPAIVQHLLEIKDQANTSTDSKGKSAGFLKLLLSRQFLEFLNFMVDVTSVLGQLSQSFQKTEINMSEIPKLVKDTVTSLDKLKSHFKPVHSASWEKLAIKYKTSAPNLFCMVDLVLTLPAHSVEWIVLEGPTESEFDPIPAIDYWNGAARKARRPFQPPYGQRKCREEPEESEGEENQEFKDYASIYLVFTLPHFP